MSEGGEAVKRSREVRVTYIRNEVCKAQSWHLRTGDVSVHRLALLAGLPLVLLFLKGQVAQVVQGNQEDLDRGSVVPLAGSTDQ